MSNEELKPEVTGYKLQVETALKKPDRRRFNRPKSSGNRSFKKHNKLRFMKTEGFRDINK
jgi:hypothetical protein